MVDIQKIGEIVLITTSAGKEFTITESFKGNLMINVAGGISSIPWGTEILEILGNVPVTKIVVTEE